jgi:F0F1-type ATP synthase membrane subunit b/b'
MKLKITLIITVLLIAADIPILWAKDKIKEKIETPLKLAIQTRQKSQKELDKWEKERIKLQAKYDALLEKNNTLTKKRSKLILTEASQKAFNDELSKREKESRQISEEIGPFIENVYAQIEDLIASGLPFLAQERTSRMSKLKVTLQDEKVSLAEKYRKVMEALLIEAEYGNTIEVYQEKIQLQQKELLGNIFRLGRISLFFLTLDHKTAAYFNVAQKQWTVLDNRYLSDIHAAIEMGSKRRPIELLCLPIGKLKVQ